ncbi:MAG: hypothetical protein KDA58_01645 [Planctomycetaceae bacterium]|nr:hypothetical protein [Planctomycetaceae bacterium]
MRTSIAVLSILALSSSAALAQPGPGGPGRGGFRPPVNPLVEALDADKDGEISAEEIEGAAAALKKLDKDGDGKLSGEEIRPPRPSFGGPGGAGGGFSAEGMIARFMENDKDGDGVLTAEELGERGARMMENGDKNKDGKLDKAELEEIAKQFAERFRGGRGRGEGGDRGEGGRRPEGEAGDRPARPEA